MYFDELDLNDNVLDALYDMRFDTCTPVQEKCIPEILEGHDVLGVAQTGTGKTAAYLLPVLSKLDDGGYPKDAINCVIMSPTRELAQQIDQAMQGFGYYLQDVSSVAVYGGNDGNRYDQELKSLRMGADVVIATPGRLITHISLGNVDLSKVSFFILDEADRMLDMGFSEDINTIAAKLPKTCQTIMFSATMPEKIEELAKSLLKDPVEIKLAVSKPAEKIKQEAYVCYETQKMTIIKDIFKAGDMKRANGVDGNQMMMDMREQAERFGTEMRDGSITHIDFENRPYRVEDEDGKAFTTDTIIIATGATAKYLGLEDEEKYKGQGVSACATCDGFFYRKRTVAVVGGGDTACEEALYLASLAKKVYMIVRKPFLRAAEIMQQRVKEKENIEILFETNTKGLFGDNGVEGAHLVRHLGELNEEAFDIAIDGFFLAIGHKPNTELFKGHIDLDEQGFIKVVPGTSTTNLPGIFAAGDVADPVYRQGVVAAGSGAKAAIEADRYLQKL